MGLSLSAASDLALGAGEVTAAVEGDSEVVVVVGVVGVGVRGALEERGAILVLAGEATPWSLTTSGKWQARGDEGEGVGGVGVLGALKRARPR